jgi:hypothetical protein
MHKDSTMRRPDLAPLDAARLEYDRLAPLERAALHGWIQAHIQPARGVCRLSSYGLKHLFQYAPGGFYVHNAAFKQAMWRAGYAPLDAGAVNWRFRARVRAAGTPTHADT